VKTTGILILDGGSAWEGSLVRALRSLGVYAEVHPWDADPAATETLEPAGIVLCADAPGPDRLRRAVIRQRVPILALGGAAATVVQAFRGRVGPPSDPGPAPERVGVLRQSPLFASLADQGPLDLVAAAGLRLVEVPKGFVATAKGERTGALACEHLVRRIFALRAHPEAPGSGDGLQILANFSHNICEVPGSWDLTEHVKQRAMQARTRMEGARALAVVDRRPGSWVAARLLLSVAAERTQVAVLESGEGLAPRVEAALGVRPWSLEVPAGLEGAARRAWLRDALARVAARAEARFRCRGMIRPARGPSSDAEALPGDPPLRLEPLRGLLAEEVPEAGALLGLPDETLAQADPEDE